MRHGNDVDYLHAVNDGAEVDDLHVGNVLVIQVNDEFGALGGQNGARRHQRGVFQRFHRGADADEHAGPQRQVRIGNVPDDVDGAGLGIHIPVNGYGFALHGVFRAVGQNHVKLDVLLTGQIIVHGVQEVPFAHGEIHPDGVNGGNGGQRRGAGGRQQVADGRGCQAGQTGNGGCNGGEFKIDFCFIHLGLCRGDGGFRFLDLLQGVVQLLAADGAGFHQRGVAFHVQLVFFQRGFILFQSPLGLVQRCLERAGINLEKHLALLDISAVPVILGKEVSRHLGADFGIFRAAQGAHPFLPDGNILRDQFGHLHFGNERRRLGCGILFPFAGS